MPDALSVQVENYCHMVAEEYDKANPGELARRGIGLAAFKHSITTWRLKNDNRLNETDVNRPTLKVQIEKAIQDGLLVDGDQATIMLFNNRSWGQLEAKYSQGYKGMVKLAMKTGQVDWIHCDVHYSNDPHWVRKSGSHPSIEHVPWEGKKIERGDLVCSYAIIQFKNGHQKLEVTTPEDLDAMRKMGERGGTSAAWGGDFADEMRKIKPLRRAMKWVYLDADLELSLARYDEYDRAPEATEGAPAPANEDEARELPHKQPEPEPEPEPEAPAESSPAKQALQKAAARNGNGGGGQEEPDHVKQGPPL